MNWPQKTANSAFHAHCEPEVFAVLWELPPSSTAHTVPGEHRSPGKASACDAVARAPSTLRSPVPAPLVAAPSFRAAARAQARAASQRAASGVDSAALASRSLASDWASHSLQHSRSSTRRSAHRRATSGIHASSSAIFRWASRARTKFAPAEFGRRRINSERGSLGVGNH